jgi:uncharacterized membrane protein
MSTTSISQLRPGRAAAFAVYGLYLLSIPSFAIFALVGVILALVSREGAEPLARSHLDDQIRVWFIAFWWAVGLAIVGAIGVLLTVVLIGFPILWIVCLIGLGVMLWFTIKSLLGLLALLDDRMR